MPRHPAAAALEPLGLPPRRAQEFADIGVVAAGKFGRRAQRQQPSRAHHRDAVGEQDRLGHVMGDHDRGQPELVVQRAVVVAERIAGEGIERAERLVHQHDPRPRRQAPGRRRRAGAGRRTIRAAGGRDVARGRAAPDRAVHRPARRSPPPACRAASA